jgi:hypothetical protein
MFHPGFIFADYYVDSGGLDPDAQAYINQVISVGGSLSATEISAVNQLTLDLKSAGIWNSFDIFLPVLGSTAASCKINLIEPSNATYDWDYLGTPTFSATGVKGNGTDAAVRALWKMNDLVKSQVGNAHWSSYQKYYSSSTGNLNGVFDVGATFFIHGVGFGQNTGFGGGNNGIYSGQIQGGSANQYDGFLYGEAENSSSEKIYIQNSLYLTANTAQSALGANAGHALLAIYFHGYNADNVYDLRSPNELRSFSIGSYLDTAQRNAYYTAIQAFQTTLGRQV